MAERTSPTHEEFEEKFRESIRVGFNWDRFLSERWPIERVMLVSENDLGRCFTPWYVGKAVEEFHTSDIQWCSCDGRRPRAPDKKVDSSAAEY